MSRFPFRRLNLHLNTSEWIAAMRYDIKLIEKDQVWKLVSLLSGRKYFGTKWVLKIKRSAYGSTDKCEVRLVEKGYT